MWTSMCKALRCSGMERHLRRWDLVKVVITYYFFTYLTTFARQSQICVEGLFIVITW